MTSWKIPRALLSITGLFLMMAMLAVPGRGLAAQDSPDVDMGDCVTALGIGAEGDACISVVNASPDAPNVDIYLNGERALGGLGFGWWSGWLAVPTGDYQVQVTPTGSAADAGVIDANVSVEAGIAYHVAAAGTYDLEVRPAGTTDVALDLPGVVLEAGTVYDVFAIGLLADGSLNVLVVPSSTGGGTGM